MHMIFFIDYYTHLGMIVIIFIIFHVIEFLFYFTFLSVAFIAQIILIHALHNLNQSKHLCLAYKSKRESIVLSFQVAHLRSYVTRPTSPAFLYLSHIHTHAYNILT
jgi:hypothetical protein